MHGAGSILSCILFLFFYARKCQSAFELSTKMILHAIRDEIVMAKENTVLKHKSHDQGFASHYQTLQRFVHNKFGNITCDLPVLVIKAGLRTHNFGNNLGNFLTDIACAELSGLHVVFIDDFRHYEHEEREEYREGEAFFDAIPPMIVHANPANNRAQALERYLHHCGSHSPFPWDATGFTQECVDILPVATRQVLLPALDAVAEFMGINETTTTMMKSERYRSSFTDIPSLGDILSNEEKSLLPQYPDVVVHYRCSDNIFFKNMGLLQFFHVIHLIPGDAKYIFILTEDRDLLDIKERLCRPIVNELANDIRKAFPSATVVIRRGGSSFDAILLMSRATKVMIGSASTFSFYFGIANTKAKVLLPERTFYNHFVNSGNVVTVKGVRAINCWPTNDTDTCVDAYEDLSLDSMLSVLRNTSFSSKYLVLT